MATPRFVHLHLHTDYSLLDGACDITELVNEAAHQGMPAVAVTDHGNLFAAEHFHHEASTRGVKPIIGCEVYVARTSRHDRGAEKTNGDARPARTAGSGPGGGSAASGPASDLAQRGTNLLVLLCENAEGYRNLIRLVSAGFLEGFYYKPRIDYDLLAKHSRGLIALSACLSGAVAEPLIEGRYDDARDAAYRLRDIFGKGNFFLEVQDQGLEIDGPVNRELVRLSRESGIPLVATNDCHYLTRADARAQEVLLCIQTGKTMSDPQRMRFATDQFYFKTAEEMAQVFRELPDALERTAAIAERCNVRIEPVRNSFPEFQVPDGYTVDSYFERVAREGFAARLPYLETFAKQGWLRRPLAEYEQRLSNETKMIVKMRYAGYFLIVWDFMRYARAQGIPVGPGRGSAAGSLVAYALKITDVDPIRHQLLFERFLNPGRKSMPDIDVDFCVERRDEVIRYIKEKYGADRVAQIITFGTLKGKQAIKDVGRVLEFSYGDTDRLAKLYPAPKQGKDFPLEAALEMEPRLREVRERGEREKKLFDYSLKLEGLLRHASKHAAGIVISPTPLVEHLPLFVDKEGSVLTQYAGPDVDTIGLIKFDFLGLKTLTLLDDAVKRIRKSRDHEIDLSALPLADRLTYQTLARGDTVGVFQMEGSGIRKLITQLKPTCFEDIVAVIALFRPGPLDSGAAEQFIRRKHGKEPITYLHPLLEPVLKETYGVPIYQEQVMQIAQVLAGYSLAEADNLRRAMGKKSKEVMQEERVRFLEGAAKQKVPDKLAGEIFDQMETFAAYGFNKSHAASYALISYQTAYLKAHYPQEFMAGLLSLEMDDTNKTYKNIAECRLRGIPVLPPDVNESDEGFTVSGETIRFGLGAVKGVGSKAIEVIQAARQDGPFTNLYDFCTRVRGSQVNKRVLESLIKCED